MNLSLGKIGCNLNPKAQAVNKAQRQLRPESCFLEFFKSMAQVSCEVPQKNLDRIGSAVLTLIEHKQTPEKQST